MSARTTRRRLFGAPAAMLLVGCAAAGEAKAAELDGELIDACARYVWLEKECGRLIGLMDWLPSYVPTPAEAALVAQFDELEAERSELVEWLTETTPRTPEGVQSKARATLSYVEGDGVTLGLVFSLLQDVAGEARA